MKSFTNFIGLFFIILVSSFIILNNFPYDNPLGNLTNNLRSKHFHSEYVNLSGLEGPYYQLVNYEDQLLSQVDQNFPLFPSKIRLNFWNQDMLAIHVLLPAIFLISFFVLVRPRAGLTIFILFLVWLIPFSKIINNELDKFVTKNKFDLHLPWSNDYVLLNPIDNKKYPYVGYTYTWVQKNESEKNDIYVSCFGHYTLYVNEEVVNRGPIFATLPNIYVDRIDINPYIRVGQNSIYAVCVYVDEITHEHQVYEGQGLIIGGKIQDGLFSHNLADNRLWKYSLLRSIKPVENLFDAGYTEAYDLTTKDNLHEIPEGQKPSYKILPRPLPLLKNQGLKITEVSSGIYDLGRFSTGYLSLQSDGKKTCNLTITFGVSLNGNGFPNEYMHQEDTVKFPTGLVDWQQFSRRSGRYVGLSGDCDLRSVKPRFIQVYNDFERPTANTSLNEIDKKIFDISLNSLVNNVQDHIEDSVDRERATYLGDSIPVSKCLLTRKGNEEIVKQTIIQFAQNQNPDGSFPSMAPSGLNQLIPSYSLMWPELLYIYLSRTEDKKFAREMWPHLEKMLSWTENNESKLGFFYNKHQNKTWWNFIDWTPTSQSFEYQTVNQFWYINSLQRTSQIAKILDNDTDIYQKKAEDLRENLIKYSFNDDTHIFFDSFNEEKKEGISLVSNALAGSIGLFPNKEENDLAIDYFRNNYFTQSPFSQTWVIDWLIKSNKKDIALEVVRGYWGSIVETGATSLYEKYEPDILIPNEENESYSHAWGCSPIYLYQEIFK